MAWKVKFFQTARGSYPVKEFIQKQERSIQTRIAQSIRLLADYGPYLKPPHIKKIQNKLYELRIRGKVSIRIFYLIFKNEYYLLHAFQKKEQKTPARELKTALDRMKEII
jgi:phage-related protein